MAITALFEPAPRTGDGFTAQVKGVAGVSIQQSERLNVQRNAALIKINAFIAARQISPRITQRLTLFTC